MREVIKTDRAPAALGPYSQAIKVRGGTFVFSSGQIAPDPKTGNLIGSTAAEQTRQIMENLKAVFEAAGAHLSDVVKTTMYLIDMNDFSSVNDAYAAFFTGSPPARSTVEVRQLPKGARVEIDAIAILP